ncbi:actin filament-associated protein 1-like 2 isoform X3 [Osmerus eperlanus]|uniref:actin filament-associated protein 1-like 2 isoform X3 n=1 Tax=Osmerus eperlanus TaxID=29151 RepID=UPI002E1174EF
MEKHKVLDLLLVELQRFLVVLDKENLSGNATIQKGVLSDLLQSYRGNGGDEEYIYMNKVTVPGKGQDKTDKGEKYDLTNGKGGKPVPAPQKSLPDLPPPRTGVVGREPFPLPVALPVTPAPACLEEGYYEEAQPYDSTNNDDGEAVSSSYESYDEEEVTKGKSTLSAQHQWPSTEASIELMKDARICAFLWRKKWLGQWAKQLCVIREHRLMCYKSSKDQTPLLDVSLLGCTVVYKEKLPKKKEHKLKVIPMGGETLVLGLQSKEQAEQWLKVILEISPRPAEGQDAQHQVSDSPRLICTKVEQSERYSVMSESGSSTDSHAEVPENKDVKKKYGAGLKFSNLMNMGKKKPLSLEISEKCVDTSGYLNVLVNSHWRSRWCLIRNGQLWLYQDKGKTKVAQQPVPLEGCMVVPDPSPEHLYSFRIENDRAQLATLEAKSSADMGHWLGLLLSQTGSKTDPEELTYDYVNSERISSIVNAAKTSLYLMQRRFSEPNNYIDSLPSVPHGSDDLYDDVPSIEADPEDAEDSSLLESREDSGVCGQEEPCGPEVKPALGSGQEAADQVYLDLIPVRSFLHTSGGRTSPLKDSSSPTAAPAEGPLDPPSTVRRERECLGSLDVESNSQSDLSPSLTQNGTNPTATTSRSEPESRSPCPSPIPLHTPPQKNTFPSQDTPRKANPGTKTPPVSSAAPLSTHTPKTQVGLSTASLPPHSPQPPRGRSTSSGDKIKALSTGHPGAIEAKLGKNRTEADLRRYTDERDGLEREREEVRSSLAHLKKQRRGTKEELSTCQDPGLQASLEACLKQKEEACREAERRRVEVELRLMEVKENLRKVESGPFTLGTTLNSLQDTPTPKAVSMTTTQTSNSGDLSSPINSATALKNRPASVMSSSKGNVLEKAKEWEKKSTT